MGGGCFLKGNEMGAMFFCKKWTFPSQNETKLILDLKFFSLHFTYLGGAYAPNAPPLPTGLKPLANSHQFSGAVVASLSSL